MIRQALPGGEEEGEIIDLYPPGNMPHKLEKSLSTIIDELGTVSLIPDMRRVVIVHQMDEFRTAQKGSLREAKANAKGKPNPVDTLANYLRKVHLTTNNILIFVYLEDDEKNKVVNKTSALYQLISSLGPANEYREKRLDWQVEEALFNADLSLSVTLIRDWISRGGNAQFRLVTTLNGVLQLLLQARLAQEAREKNQSTTNAFAGLRPSLESVPPFKAKKAHTLASRISLPALRKAFVRFNQIQCSFFPKGTEVVVHDALEQTEIMLAELFAAARTRAA
ncbi:MAG: hypothetical protein ACFCU1_04440 [Sumerlaeia bacterium]